MRHQRSAATPATDRSADERPVLVTGATGFIGLAVCRLLSQRGIPTRAMFRRRHRAALLAPLDVDLVHADLTSPPSIARAVDGCRGVVHLGGRATFEPFDRLRPTVVDGTRTLVELAERAGVERLVFGSSLFVHGPTDGVIVDESSSATPTLDYGAAKLLAEASVHEAEVSAGGVSVRLPHVYGWNDLLFGVLRSGYLPFPADLDVRFPHLHVDDAADALVAALDRGGVGPAVVADDAPVTWRTFFEVVTTYSPTSRIIPLPATPVRLALSLIDRLPLRTPTMLAADTIRGWNLELQTEPGTLARFGLTPRFPSVETGIPDVLDSALPWRWRHPVLDRGPRRLHRAPT